MTLLLGLGIFLGGFTIGIILGRPKQSKHHAIGKWNGISTWIIHLPLTISTFLHLYSEYNRHHLESLHLYYNTCRSSRINPYGLVWKYPQIYWLILVSPTQNCQLGISSTPDYRKNWFYHPITSAVSAVTPPWFTYSTISSWLLNCPPVFKRGNGNCPLNCGF